MSDIDNQDDLSFSDDDFSNMNTSSIPHEVKQTIKEIGKESGRALESLTRENLSNAALVADDMVNIYSSVKTIGQDTFKQLGKSLNTITGVGLKALPLGKKIIPKKIYGGLEKVLNKIHREEADPESEAERKRKIQESEITSALGEIFKSQQAAAEESKSSAAVSRAMDQAKFAASQKLAGVMNKHLSVMSAFTTGPLTGYLKKSLELKYKSLFISTDLLSVTYKIENNLSKRLEELTKYAMLTDAEKSNMTGKAKSVVGGRTGQSYAAYRNTFISKMLENMKKRAAANIANIAGFGDMFGVVEAMLPMLAESGGFGFGDVAKIGLSWGANKLIKKYGSGAADRNRSLLRLLNQDFGVLRNNIPDYIANFVNKNRNATGILSWIANMIDVPTYSGQQVVERNTIKDPNATVPFDLTVRNTIVEIIPAHLERIGDRIDLYVRSMFPGYDFDSRDNKYTYSIESNKFVSFRERESELTERYFISDEKRNSAIKSNIIESQVIAKSNPSLFAGSNHLDFESDKFLDAQAKFIQTLAFSHIEFKPEQIKEGYERLLKQQSLSGIEMFSKGFTHIPDPRLQADIIRYYYSLMYPDGGMLNKGNANAIISEYHRFMESIDNQQLGVTAGNIHGLWRIFGHRFTKDGLFDTKKGLSDTTIDKIDVESEDFKNSINNRIDQIKANKELIDEYIQKYKINLDDLSEDEKLGFDVLNSMSSVGSLSPAFMRTGIGKLYKLYKKVTKDDIFGESDEINSKNELKSTDAAIWDEGDKNAPEMTTPELTKVNPVVDTSVSVNDKKSQWHGMAVTIGTIIADTIKEILGRTKGNTLYNQAAGVVRSVKKMVTGKPPRHGHGRNTQKTQPSVITGNTTITPVAPAVGTASSTPAPISIPTTNYVWNGVSPLINTPILQSNTTPINTTYATVSPNNSPAIVSSANTVSPQANNVNTVSQQPNIPWWKKLTNMIKSGATFAADTVRQSATDVGLGTRLAVERVGGLFTNTKPTTSSSTPTTTVTATPQPAIDPNKIIEEDKKDKKGLLSKIGGKIKDVWNRHKLKFDGDPESKFHADFRQFALKMVDILGSSGLMNTIKATLGGMTRVISSTMIGIAGLALGLPIQTIKGLYKGGASILKGEWIDDVKKWGKEKFEGAKRLGKEALGAGKAVLGSAFNVTKSALGAGWDATKGAAGWTWKLAHGLLGNEIPAAIKGVSKFLFDPPYVDIYLKDYVQGDPILTAATQKNGVYFEGNVLVEKSSQIDKPVYDSEGNILINQAQLTRGLVDKDNKPISGPGIFRKGGLAHMGLKVMGGVLGAGKDLVTGLFGLGKDLMTDGFGGIKKFFGNMKDKLFGGSSKMNADSYYREVLTRLDKLIELCGGTSGTIGGGNDSDTSGPSKERGGKSRKNKKSLKAIMGKMFKRNNTPSTPTPTTESLTPTPESIEKQEAESDAAQEKLLEATEKKLAKQGIGVKGADAQAGAAVAGGGLFDTLTDFLPGGREIKGSARDILGKRSRIKALGKKKSLLKKVGKAATSRKRAAVKGVLSKGGKGLVNFAKGSGRFIKGWGKGTLKLAGGTAKLGSKLGFGAVKALSNLSPLKMGGKIGGKLLGAGAKLLGGGLGGFLGAGAKFLPGIGTALTAGKALWDGFKGWKNAGNIAGLAPGQKATLGQKAGAALASAASGLTFGLLGDADDIYGAGKKTIDYVKNSTLGKWGMKTAKFAAKYANPFGLAFTGAKKLWDMTKKGEKEADKARKKAEAVFNKAKKANEQEIDLLNVDKAKAVREAKDRGASDAEIEQIKADYDKKIAEAEERHKSPDNPAVKAEQELAKREDELKKKKESHFSRKMLKTARASWHVLSGGLIGKEPMREALDITTGKVIKIKKEDITRAKSSRDKIIIPSDKSWYVVPMNKLFTSVKEEMTKGVDRKTAVETVVSRYAEHFNDPDESINHRHKQDLSRIALTECEKNKIDGNWKPASLDDVVKGLSKKGNKGSSEDGIGNSNKRIKVIDGLTHQEKQLTHKEITDTGFMFENKAWFKNYDPIYYNFRDVLKEATKDNKKSFTKPDFAFHIWKMFAGTKVASHYWNHDIVSARNSLQAAVDSFEPFKPFDILTKDAAVAVQKPQTPDQNITEEHKRVMDNVENQTEEVTTRTEQTQATINDQKAKNDSAHLDEVVYTNVDRLIAKIDILTETTGATGDKLCTGAEQYAIAATGVGLNAANKVADQLNQPTPHSPGKPAIPVDRVYV